MHTASSPTRRIPLHLGFIAPSPYLTPNTLSGMPFRMLSLLEQRFERVSILLPASTRTTMDHFIHIAPAMLFPYSRRARASLRRSLQRAASNVRDAIPGAPYRHVLKRAAIRSKSVQRAVESHDLDVIFGCCISSHLYALETDVPIVYFSDATASIINSSYPSCVRTSPSYKQACHLLETTAVNRCTAAAYASELALQSAIDEYGLDPHCGAVIPMGANVMPGPDLTIVRKPPEGRRLHLSIAAADPIRKRLDLAIDTAERLGSRGWDITLTHIGPPTHRSRQSSVVECAGQLKLSDHNDRLTHQRILARSHLMLLPSIGEAFGIAPCEAAHFACPSVVSNAGGLPTVVQHNETGLVLPLHATADDYANQIESLITSPERYLTMCAAALRRARALFTWDRWADTMTAMITAAAAPDARKPEIVVRARRPALIR